MQKRMISAFFPMAAICFIAACQSGTVEYKYPHKIDGRYEMLTEQQAEKQNETVFDKKYLTFDLNIPRETTSDETQKQTVKEPVKQTATEPQKPLWKNVLPVLSEYPVAEIREDSFITTEWFSASGDPLRQLKINAVKTGDFVRLSVLCRQKDKNGEWINQKNDEALADIIKNDIVKQSMNN